MVHIELNKEWEEASRFAYSQIKHEKARRHFLALQAIHLGYGGISAIARTFNVSRRMIRDGIREIQDEGLFTEGRQRKEGAGRPSIPVQFTNHMGQLLKDPTFSYMTIPSATNKQDAADSTEVANVQDQCNASSITDKSSANKDTVKSRMQRRRKRRKRDEVWTLMELLKSIPNISN